MNDTSPVLARPSNPRQSVRQRNSDHALPAIMLDVPTTSKIYGTERPAHPGSADLNALRLFAASLDIFRPV